MHASRQFDNANSRRVNVLSPKPSIVSIRIIHSDPLCVGHVTFRVFNEERRPIDHKPIEAMLDSVGVQVMDIVNEAFAVEIEGCVAKDTVSGAGLKCSQQPKQLLVGGSCHCLDAGGSVNMCHCRQRVG